MAPRSPWSPAWRIHAGAPGLYQLSSETLFLMSRKANYTMIAKMMIDANLTRCWITIVRLSLYSTNNGLMGPMILPWHLGQKKRLVCHAGDAAVNHVIDMRLPKTARKCNAETLWNSRSWPWCFVSLQGRQRAWAGRREVRELPRTGLCWEIPWIEMGNLVYRIGSGKYWKHLSTFKSWLWMETCPQLHPSVEPMICPGRRRKVPKFMEKWRLQNHH